MIFGRDVVFSAEICMSRTVEDACPYNKMFVSPIEVRYISAFPSGEGGPLAVDEEIIVFAYHISCSQIMLSSSVCSFVASTFPSRGRLILHRFRTLPTVDPAFGAATPFDSATLRSG